MSEYLLKKSQTSNQSSCLLQKNGFYSSVIHCSYYSCLQLIKHILIADLGFSEEEINIKSADGGSHKFLINRIKESIKQRGFPGRGKFRRSIMDLKTAREDADYCDIEINEDFGEDSIKLSLEILKYLTKNYGYDYEMVTI